ncbi:MAG: NUDIX hydrolase [Gaiellaceae bacterium]
MREDDVSAPPVRAAGGILSRRTETGLEVLVVHRPRYDDWGFPKGKCLAHESDEACALREVDEETGFRCRLGQDVGATSYVDSRGRPKEVRYWTMEALAGSFRPGDEVDEIRWLGLVQAIALLTYERDRLLLMDAASRL